MNKEIPECKSSKDGRHRWNCRDYDIPTENSIPTPNYVEVVWECYNCGLVISQAYTSDGCGWNIEKE